LDITYGGEEEEIEEVHLSQNIVNTRSASKKTSLDTPNTSNTPTSTTFSTKQASSPTSTTAPNIPKTTPYNHK